MKTWRKRLTDRINQSINKGAICKLALATQGLLIISKMLHCFFWIMCIVAISRLFGWSYARFCKIYIFWEDILVKKKKNHFTCFSGRKKKGFPKFWLLKMILFFNVCNRLKYEYLPVNLLELSKQKYGHHFFHHAMGNID